MKNLGYYNGKCDEIEKVLIPMYDRACFFGDGIYDATYSRNYKIFALDEHVDRFFSSAELLAIDLPCTKQELKDLLNDLVRKMDSGENFVYFQATRGGGPVRNHTFTDGAKANLWVNMFHKSMVDIYKKIKMISLEDTRFFHCNIKTINLIPAVVAAEKAKQAGCFEAVLHRSGRVTEGSHSNVHIIKDGTLITAPLDNLILPGIARRHIIRACGVLGIPVEERPYRLEDLFAADEVLVSSASTMCLSAQELDGKPVGGKAPELLKKLQDYLWNEFVDETAE
ncbi:MAG: aminotransferase class IV [Oscillospiraceae bacterium]|nr:aminotransferase class IV [Oscillospiraceae bacterium]